MVAPLAWQDGNSQNMAVLEVIRTLPDLLGVSRTDHCRPVQPHHRSAGPRCTRRRYQMHLFAYARCRWPGKHDPFKCHWIPAVMREARIVSAILLAWRNLYLAVNPPA